MSKLLLLIFLACLGWYFWRRLRLPRPPAPPAPAQRQAERMVACARCGVNIPEGESLRLGSRHFCCAEHQRAAEAEREQG
ncbi:PP0621 family protein [Rhodocyclus tenuis]|uniref:Preprotein translocase subunit YajC n=1 Tax=Rhodocyclus tenuis TaxID=1066 RepID=A0A840G6E9_RHOTE|nr:PP0621 family protein [Rhodocyclus tenuis]MBB4247455.1 uncharacterized protein [Rhodocyclus tenuis]MBK1681157.1 hypothetical protein [Rhodocyclus tenuis]